MGIDPAVKILLVEDAGTMRKMEIQLLARLGFENVVQSVNGNDAIVKLKTEPDIALVISDWAMPEMDGYELLTWVRSRKEFAHIPFLMATGQGDRGSVARAVEAGASGVVAKPFSAEDLKAKIDESFGIKEKAAPNEDTGPRITGQGKVRLKIAHIQITDHLTLGVMKHLMGTGEQTADCFELETQCLPGWNPVEKALEQGDVDAAFVLAPIAMDLFNYGVPIKLVLFAHKNGSIFVRSKVEEYRQPYQIFFKHKTVFIPHKMSIHNMLAHMYLSKMGLKPGLAGKEAVNVLFDVVPPVEMPRFLAENSDCRGFMVAEPIGSRAIAAGLAERQFISSEIWDNHPCCVVVFREEFIEKFPDAVQEFAGKLMDAGQFIAGDCRRSAQIAVSFLDPNKKLGLEAPLLERILTEPKGIRTDDLFPVLEDLDMIQRYMKEKMGIGRLMDVEQFVDIRFAEEAVRQDPSRRHKKTENAPAQVRGAKADERVGSFEREAIANRGGKHLSFGLAGEHYAVSILDVREIVGMLPIRSMPTMPEFVKGVVNLRDRVIPVIDMRLKFGMESAEYTKQTCIIITEISGIGGSTLVGLVVDNVLEVTDIKEEEIQDTPEFGVTVDTRFITGMVRKGDSVVILLDIDRILHTDEKIQIGNAA